MAKRTALILILVLVLNIPCALGQIIDVPDQLHAQFISIQHEIASPTPWHPETQSSVGNDKIQWRSAGIFDASEVGPLSTNLMVILFAILALVMTRQRD